MSGDASALEAQHAHEHEEEAAGHGHGHDPNAGVVVGEPPTPAWVLTAFAIAALTAVLSVWLAIAIG